jgi:hypothetical protein
LGQVAARLTMLDVACNRCDRRGRLRADRLLAEHGPDLPMPKLRRIIAAEERISRQVDPTSPEWSAYFSVTR